MAWDYKKINIILGEPSHHGHLTYLNAQYFFPGVQEQPRKIIYKQNKLDRKSNSTLEVAFTQLARLFLPRGLTAPQKIVKDELGKTVGVATEHICYAVAEKEGISKNFYALNNPQIDCTATAAKVAAEEDIPCYFFEKLPKDYFSQLIKAQQQGLLTIDYSSLANFLAGCYTLEEDDLHRGNFGFYLVEKDNKPHAVFFKIDHDLMFTESIMSHKALRFSNAFHLGNAFAITANDLINFPFIVDSVNKYWPTIINFFYNPWSNKLSQSKEEQDAFAQLAQVEEFKKAKWLAFYKHILTPLESIEWSLKECLDENDPVDRAQIALIAHALTARLARLRAVLFSIKEFRDFVKNLTTEEYDALFLEQQEMCPKNSNTAALLDKLTNFKELAKSAALEGDTPLHTALRLNNYRFEETMGSFSRFINVKNTSGSTPLDLALKLYQSSTNEDNRKEAAYVMNHLIEHGATKSAAFEQCDAIHKFSALTFQTTYLKSVDEAKTYDALKGILRNIGDTHSYSLKTKKNAALQCIAHFTKVNQGNPGLPNMLRQLKREVNGEADKSACADLKYIRQLRSRLWLVRQIRGLHGHSSTLSAINSLVEGEIVRTQAKTSSFCAFFSLLNRTLPAGLLPEVVTGQLLS